MEPVRFERIVGGIGFTCVHDRDGGRDLQIFALSISALDKQLVQIVAL
jgi:hypothetical protein